MGDMEEMWLDAVHNYLASPDWRDEISLFIDSQCPLFAEQGAYLADTSGMPTVREFDHSQHAVWLHFQEIVEGLMNDMLTALGGSIESLEKAIDERADALPQGSDSTLSQILQAMMTVEDYSAFSMMMANRARELSEQAEAELFNQIALQGNRNGPVGAVEQLIQLGFSAEAATAALEQFPESVEDALDFLLESSNAPLVDPMSSSAKEPLLFNDWDAWGAYGDDQWSDDDEGGGGNAVAMSKGDSKPADGAAKGVQDLPEDEKEAYALAANVLAKNTQGTCTDVEKGLVPWARAVTQAELMRQQLQERESQWKQERKKLMADSGAASLRPGSPRAGRPGSPRPGSPRARPGSPRARPQSPRSMKLERPIMNGAGGGPASVAEVKAAEAKQVASMTAEEKQQYEVYKRRAAAADMLEDKLVEAEKANAALLAKEASGTMNAEQAAAAKEEKVQTATYIEELHGRLEEAAVMEERMEEMSQRFWQLDRELKQQRELKKQYETMHLHAKTELTAWKDQTGGDSEEGKQRASELEEKLRKQAAELEAARHDAINAKKFEAQLSAAAEEMKDLKVQQKRAEEIESELKTASAELISLRNRSTKGEAVESELKTAMASLNSKHAEAAGMEKKMKEMQSHKKKLESDLKEHHAHKEKISGDLASAQKEVEAQKAAVDKMKAELEKHSGSAAENKKAIAAKEAELAANTVRMESLAKRAGDAEALEAKMSSMTAEYQSANAEIKELKKTAAKAKQTESELQDMNEKYSTLEKDFKEQQVLRRKYHNMLEDMKGKIRVFARCRPMSESEKQRGCSTCVNFVDDRTIEVTGTGAGGGGPKQYMFDAVFGPDGSQDEIFQDTEMLLTSALDGFNVCIFAYGQTGSGKTWTMTGPGPGELAGLTPRAITGLFAKINSKAYANQYEVKVTSYFVEIYKDGLNDLYQRMDKTPEQKLDIKMDAHDMCYVRNTTVKEAKTEEELWDHFSRGNEMRKVGSTKMNAGSSRSHSIFAVCLETLNKTTGQTAVGKLSLIDLAGSERSKKTEATKEQLLEAVAINKSLSCLGDVISALSSGQKFIPYRNSKLTQLMQDSLGGNAKTLMFVNVSPADYNAEETNSSLGYAARVKLIQNQAKRTSESSEVLRLKRIISAMQAGNMDAAAKA